MNVPDTVSSARIEKLCEECGTLRKLVLRPDHGGAIVEYADEKSVGVASLALDGKELDGQKITVGTVDQLFKQSGQYKPVPKIGHKKPFAAGMVPRAAQNAAASRRGGRGGLGQKKGLGFGRKAATPDDSGGKSNDDFRAMLLKGKESETKPESKE
jgi:hypothetical protein